MIPPRYAHLIGSKWTSSAPLLGWRQFNVVNARRGVSGWSLELAASVEPKTHTWIPAANISDPARFTAGWAAAPDVRVPDPIPEAPVARAR
jgi:tryptophan-rich hypothetical protein